MSIIYKIFCKNKNIKDCYIGSTNNLNIRKATHKYACNNINSKQYNLKVYKFIRANDGFTNFDFEVLETFNTIDKQDLHKIECQYIKNNNSTLNTQIPTRTHKESDKNYYDNNKEKILLYKKQKVICEFCKVSTGKFKLKRHQATQKCLSYQNAILNQIHL